MSRRPTARYPGWAELPGPDRHVPVGVETLAVLADHYQVDIRCDRRDTGKRFYGPDIGVQAEMAPDGTAGRDAVLWGVGGVVMWAEDPAVGVAQAGQGCFR